MLRILRVYLATACEIRQSSVIEEDGSWRVGGLVLPWSVTDKGRLALPHADLAHQLFFYASA